MILLIVTLLAQLAAPARVVAPVLAFPEPGLDDPAAYLGYRTRFFRDAAGNTVQIYLDSRDGRVVSLFADAENESIGFTVRDSGGRPAELAWESDSARVCRQGRARAVEYHIVAASPSIAVGGFLLGSMRVERDYQYQKRQLAAFGSGFAVPELERLVDAIGRLPSAERARQLAVLGAVDPDTDSLRSLVRDDSGGNVIPPSRRGGIVVPPPRSDGIVIPPARSDGRDLASLRSRLRPTVSADTTSGGAWIARIVQPSLDGRDTLTLELHSANPAVVGRLAGDSVIFRARSGSTVPLVVRISTTGRTLTPLTRAEIFTPDFLTFLAASTRDPASLRGRWLEREVRGMELLSSREKLMAGLPTYATYFGRDMLVTALMMRPIWRAEMSEFVIGAVLRKLGPHGDVSHEEALGGQAVREAAAEYVTLIDSSLAATGAGRTARADSLLSRATAVLGDRRRVRENYHMIDDEFQLAVLAGRWIADPRRTAAEKREFLLDSADGGEPRVVRLLRELALVARMTDAYARDPRAEHLVSFAARDSGRWSPASWRDSQDGYAGGRFAMDVNAIWAPHALEAMANVLDALRALGLPPESFVTREPGVAAGTPLGRFVRDRTTLQRAVTTWRGAARHFVIRLSPAGIRARVGARLAEMPEVERTYWSSLLAATGAARDSLSFLAVSLDAGGTPIGVANTDPATRLFLGESEAAPRPLDSTASDHLWRDVRLFVRPYPVGLFIDRVGPVVANDAYASPGVWRAFERDPYHGPRVVWGREVNLFLLGALNHLPIVATDAQRTELRAALQKVHGAVQASGFRSELWGYDFVNGRAPPVAVRYGSGSDVQLWSISDLAVQYALWKEQR